MSDTILEKSMQEINLREYDEDTMSKEEVAKINNYFPPILFRQVIYPDSVDGLPELEVKYLLDVDKRGALYSPWSEVPLFIVEQVPEEESDVEDERLH